MSTQPAARSPLAPVDRTRNVAFCVAVAADGRRQWVIGQDAGVNPDVISRAKRGITPNAADRAALAKTLGVAEADLFGEAAL